MTSEEKRAFLRGFARGHALAVYNIWTLAALFFFALYASAKEIGGTGSLGLLGLWILGYVLHLNHGGSDDDSQRDR